MPVQKSKTVEAKDIVLKLRAIAKETDTVDEVYALTNLSPETIKNEIRTNTFRFVTRSLTQYARKALSEAADLDRKTLQSATENFVSHIQKNLLTKKGYSSAFEIVEPIKVGDRVISNSEQLTDGLVAKILLANGDAAKKLIKSRKDDLDAYKIVDGEEGDKTEEVPETDPEADQVPDPKTKEKAASAPIKASEAVNKTDELKFDEEASDKK